MVYPKWEGSYLSQELCPLIGAKIKFLLSSKKEICALHDRLSLIRMAIDPPVDRTPKNAEPQISSIHKFAHRDQRLERFS